jgi:hypothetical protein
MFLLNILHLFCCFSEVNHTYTPKTRNLVHNKGGIYLGYLGKQIFVPGKMSSDHQEMFSHCIHHINQIHIQCSLYMTHDSTVNTGCTRGVFHCMGLHTPGRESQLINTLCFLGRKISVMPFSRFVADLCTSPLLLFFKNLSLCYYSNGVVVMISCTVFSIQ